MPQAALMARRSAQGFVVPIRNPGVNYIATLQSSRLFERRVYLASDSSTSDIPGFGALSLIRSDRLALSR
jgi:hypothetical protein